MVLYYLFLIAIGAFCFRVFFYPYTITEETFELDGTEEIEEDHIRFFSHGEMIIRNVKDQWIIRGVNHRDVRLVKFRTCGLLYNHKKYEVVLISMPEEEYNKRTI